MSASPLRAVALAFFAGSSLLVAADAPAKKSPGRTPPSSAQVSDTAQAEPISPDTQRTKLAEGEYAVFARVPEGGVGPFDPQVFDFHETWTLWRAGDGGYEVDGIREFESPKDEFHHDRFWVRLTRDWRLETIREFANLRWRPDSGPLVCDFKIGALHCTSGAKDPRQLVKLDLKLHRPFGFLWPISAFSLASLARAEEKRLREVMPVQVITIEERSPADPVAAMILDGQMRYFGKVDVTLAGHKWKADQFELKAPLHPKFEILTAPEGFLLNLSVASPAGGSAEMKLVRYQQFADFSLHPER